LKNIGLSSSVMLIDSHCHLDFPELEGELDAVLGRARAAGVGLMVTISTRVHRFNELRGLVEAHDNVFCSVGTHPHNAAEEPDIMVEELVELARHPKVVAIGEAGLDYHYDNSPRDMQKKSFRIHIAAARETGLPLIIHAREADAHIARMLEEETKKGAFPFVLHCFTGGPDLARRGLALGGSISFSGVITFKNAEPLRDIALAVPSDRLLVETDAPYLAPEPMRGKTNEPAFVVHTAARLAALRGVRETEMARMTTENFFRLFKKVPRSSLKSPQSAA
jgi:TatD DNase family protein